RVTDYCTVPGNSAAGLGRSFTGGLPCVGDGGVAPVSVVSLVRRGEGAWKPSLSQLSLMAKTRSVGVFVGSLRKESLTRKVANAIARVAPSTLNFQFIDIASVSHYNQDLESAPPADWIAFRDKVRAVDALLFAIP